MWIAATSLIIALVGLGLLAFGLRAKRVGSEPHCRRCEYNLTGAMSRMESAAAHPLAATRADSPEHSTLTLCPECGTAISPRVVKWGEKRRRVVLPVFALLLIGAGTAGVYGGWNRKLWRQQCPFSVILALANYGDVRAVAELQRRYSKSELTQPEEQRLVVAALDKQKTLPSSFALTEWLMLLAYLSQGGSLSNEQDERNWSQALERVELVVLPRYRLGERLIVGLAVDFRRLDASAWPDGEEAQGSLLERVKRDAWNAGVPERYGWVDGGFVTCAFPHRFVQTGKDDVLIRMKLQTDSSRQKEVEIHAPIEVVPADYEDSVAFLNDARIKSELETILFIDHHATTSFVDGWHLEAFVAAKGPLPCSIAADAILEDGEAAEEFVGTVYGWKGQRLVVSDIPRLPHERFSGKDITFVLRFNPDVVRKTVDLEEVFSGELRLKPVRIRPIN